MNTALSVAPMTLPSLRSFALGAILLLIAVLCSVLLLDRPLALWLNEQAPGLVPVARAFTDTMTRLVRPDLPKWVHPLLIAAIGAALSWRSGYAWIRPFLLTAGVLLATRLTVTALKTVFDRVRPFEYLADPKLGNFFVAGHDSFPSGHTAVYAGLFLPPALLFARWRAPLLALMAFCALARVAENDHYLGDVLMSVLVALVYTLLLGLALGLRPRVAHA